MVTALVALVCVFAVVAIVGGVRMMFAADGCFLSWWFGYHAMKSGFELLAAFGPLLAELVGELFSGLFSSN